MRRIFGPAAGPVAVLLPGTASTAEFVARAFGPPLASLGIGLVSGQVGLDPVEALEEAAARYRPLLVGGVSRGAHAAVRWATTGPGHRPRGLLLALPAWTGAPGAVAAASAAAADEVDALGVAGTLRAVRARTGPGWVMDELDAAWPVVPDLAAELRAAGTAPGPAHAELAAVGVACGLLALRDDPLHPAAVAHEWRSALPRAGLVETNLAAVGRDRATIGRGAVLAWLRAGGAAGEN